MTLTRPTSYMGLLCALVGATLASAEIQNPPDVKSTTAVTAF